MSGKERLLPSSWDTTHLRTQKAMLNITSPPLQTRQELEDSWHSRLLVAQAHYQTTSEHYRNLRELPDGLKPNQDDAVALARVAETQALAQYMGVLSIFTELILYGKMPEEGVAENSHGV